MMNYYAFHNAQCAKLNPISSFLKLNPFSFKMAHRNQFQCRFEKWQLLQSQQIIENWSKLSRCPKTQETKPHPRLVPTKRRQQLIFRFLAEPLHNAQKVVSDQHHVMAVQLETNCLNYRSFFFFKPKRTMNNRLQLLV